MLKLALLILVALFVTTHLLHIGVNRTVICKEQTVGGQVYANNCYRKGR